MLSPWEPLPISEADISSSTEGMEALMDILHELSSSDVADQALGQSQDVKADEPTSNPELKSVAPKPEKPFTELEEDRYLKYAQQVAHDRAYQKQISSPDALGADGGDGPQDADLLSLVTQITTRLNHLEHQIYAPTELINPLIPLITELLTLQGIGSGEAMLQALIPVIDEALTKRFQQDRSKLGAALGQILPEAIAQEIKQSPTAIATAIAPEFAVALQKQIHLDRNSVTETLGPHMGDAIKQQIVVERDAMVDALYPVIGSTISKYMGEVIQSINQKVESVFSFEGVFRKIRARLQGVSEAELILKEALGFSVQAILLVHKTSGLVIRSLQVSPDLKLEAEMWAGMLTAIRSFVNECVAQPGKVSELHIIAYDDSKIILEVAGYCYLAAVVRGEPSKPFINRLRKILSQIIVRQGQAIALYNGEPGKVSQDVDLLLAKLLQLEPNGLAPRRPSGLVVLLGLMVTLLLFGLYRSFIAHSIETKITEILDAAPELSIYRLVPKVHYGKLILSGRLPNRYLKEKAEKLVRQNSPHWSFESQVVAIAVPPDPVIAAGEIERLTWLFNQKEGVAITNHHDYGTQTVRVAGVASAMTEIEQVIQALKNIPGVATVISTVQIRPSLKTRLYFEPGSAQLETTERASKVIAIRKFLDQNPGIHLNIIGHSDPTGEQAKNKALGLRRSRAIQEALISAGVEPARLQTIGMAIPPSDISETQPLWLSRCVRFEVTIPQY